MTKTMENGIILKGIGGFYYVLTPSGTIVESKARGRFRREKIVPMVGDRVSLSQGKEGFAQIDEILPRKNMLTRPPVSNVDQLLLVIAAVPQTNLATVDAIIAAAENKGIEPILLFNKCDLDDLTPLQGLYLAAGFKTLSISCEKNIGLDAVQALYAGKTSVFCGASGVGKSSILNQTMMQGLMPVGTISDRIDRGRHTTRHVELFAAPNGGFIADTPGFSAFDIESGDPILKNDLAFLFREFAPHQHACRFTGCSHTGEPDCAVLQAVEDGQIAKSRYDSYCAMYDQVKNRKEWEK